MCGLDPHIENRFLPFQINSFQQYYESGKIGSIPINDVKTVSETSWVEQDLGSPCSFSVFSTWQTNYFTRYVKHQMMSLFSKLITLEKQL